MSPVAVANADRGHVAGQAIRIVPDGFVRAGLRFFTASLIAALAVVALAPLPAIRLLGAIACACATAGVLLHLYAMHVNDPQALVVLRQWLHPTPARAGGLALNRWN